MAINLKTSFPKSPRVLRDRQVVVVRHAVRPFLLIAAILLAVTCVCIYSKLRLKPQLLIQFSSLAVALYALYRTTSFHGKVTIGTIPTLPTLSTGDTLADVIAYRRFIVTNSFNAYVYAQIETVVAPGSAVELDLTQVPTGKVLAASSVSEMEVIVPLTPQTQGLLINVTILVVLSSGRKVEKTIPFSL